MVNEYNFADKQSPMTFGKACTWADAIKKGGEYKSMNPWHYVNVERDVDQIHAHSCQNDCITQAIPFHSQQLTANKRKNKPRTTRGPYVFRALGRRYSSTYAC